MGVLNPVSRILDITLTDKARAKMALGQRLNITKFALFDYGIDYRKVEFTNFPNDADYDVLFEIEQPRVEALSLYENRLVTIPPGTDSTRRVEVSPSTGEFDMDNTLDCAIKTLTLRKHTGEPTFDESTKYVVFLKNVEDAKYVHLLEKTSVGDEFTPPPLVPKEDDEQNDFEVT